MSQSDKRKFDRHGSDSDKFVRNLQRDVQFKDLLLRNRMYDKQLGGNKAVRESVAEEAFTVTIGMLKKEGIKIPGEVLTKIMPMVVSRGGRFRLVLMFKSMFRWLARK